MNVEPHLYCVLASSNAANELIDLFPDTDLTEEMKVLLRIQFEILEHILTKRHYGSDALEEFIEFTEEILEQKERLQNAT